MTRQLQIIEVASSLGAPFGGAELGPARLQSAGLCDRLRRQGWSLSPAIRLQPEAVDRAALPSLLHQVAAHCATALGQGRLPVIIGGDHAIAAGTWRGIGQALGRPPGLLWIDAHLDAHTPATSLSGNPHGMPVALLLGEGDPALTAIPGPNLAAERLIMIGERSAEAAERERLDRHGVRRLDAAEIGQRGLSNVIAAAIAEIGSGPWGITLDVDALDPGEAPGVSTPVADGLRTRALADALRHALHAPGFCGLEIVEFNPRFDIADQTAHAILDVVDALTTPPPG